MLPQRLAQVAVHAGGQTLLAVAHHGVRGHGDDARLRDSTPGANGPRGFVAVHLRHVAIHQNHVVKNALDRGERLATVADAIRLIAELLQRAGGDLLIHRIILRDQNPEMGLGLDPLADNPGLPALAERGAGLAGKQVGEAVVEITLFDGFDEAGLDAELAQFGRGHRLAQRTQQDQRGTAKRRLGADRPGRHQAVHLRHLHVEDDEVKRLARGGGRAQGGQRFGSGGDGLMLHAPGLEMAVKNAPVERVVIDDQCARARQVADAFPFAPDCRRLLLEPDREPEGRAPAGFAAHIHFAVHHPDQLPGDDQAQPGAAMLARRAGIGLGEGLEEALPGGGFDADPGVDHRETQAYMLVGVFELRDFERHLTALRELHGIAQQVQQHLPQPAGITPQSGRHTGGDQGAQFQPLAGGRFRHHVQRILHDFAQLKIQVFEVQFAGLDLGEIEDVIDDGQQALGAPADLLGVIELFGVQPGGQQQIRHADHAVHRGADFVAHVRQKLALRAIGRLRRVARAFEFRLGPVDVRHVVDHGQEVVHFAVLPTDALGGDDGVNDASVRS